MDTLKNELSHKGYILLKNFLDTSEFQFCCQVVDALENLSEKPGGPMKYFELSNLDQKEVLNRVEDFYLFNKKFTSDILTGKLIEILEKITKMNYLLFKDKINFKMPGSGGFNPHQDAPAFTRFVREEMYTIMLPLQETNIENGCLQVSDFFSKKIVPHENGSVPPHQLSKISWQYIPMQPGDILIFSSYLIHQSDPNKTNMPRRSFFLTYNLMECGDLRSEYFSYKRASFPPRVERSNNENYDQWKSKLARTIL